MLSYNSYKPTDKEREYVGKLINIEPNDISYTFFSDKNVASINEQLIEEIKYFTFQRYGQKMQIQPQRKHLVISAMRHIYFTNIKNIYPTEVEVDMLNKEVLKKMVPVVTRELISHMRFINDYNNIVPFDLPKPSTRKLDNTSPYSKLFDF